MVGVPQSGLPPCFTCCLLGAAVTSLCCFQWIAARIAANIPTQRPLGPPCCSAGAADGPALHACGRHVQPGCVAGMCTHSCCLRHSCCLSGSSLLHKAALMGQRHSMPCLAADVQPMRLPCCASSPCRGAAHRDHHPHLEHQARRVAPAPCAERVPTGAEGLGASRRAAAPASAANVPRARRRRGAVSGHRLLPYCPQAVVDLIAACISLDPLRRPTAAQALQCLQAAHAELGTS